MLLLAAVFRSCCGRKVAGEAVTRPDLEALVKKVRNIPEGRPNQGSPTLWPDQEEALTAILAYVAELERRLVPIRAHFEFKANPLQPPDVVANARAMLRILDGKDPADTKEEP